MPNYPIRYPAAQWIAAHPNNFSFQRANFAPEAICWHIMDGTLLGCDSWFQNPTSEVSSHLGIGKNGDVHQYVSFADTAFCNGNLEYGTRAYPTVVKDNRYANPNYYTVCIECEGKPGDIPQGPQLAAMIAAGVYVFRNVLLLSGATGVDVDWDHNLKHSDIAPTAKPYCPGWDDGFHALLIGRIRALVVPSAVTVEIPPVVNDNQAPQPPASVLPQMTPETVLKMLTLMQVSGAALSGALSLPTQTDPAGALAFTKEALQSMVGSL